ncbi:YtxH domain-containing protein [Anaerosalibacter massiliensis]|uniref:YtxH domain-containing protein n=1 Tax=Anaerosalibacter massiliensis TaxID=1347392 RepID=A0A9X2S6B3_9FIRM|nr:YtxH domain-containing protein [Anaerosalibacter massiliensis]MCR2042841.1 hypothetical protein [Anaerosalibacter massiliensis]
MNGSFKRGAFMGSLIGASAAVFAASRIGPMQKRKIRRNTRKAISNIKDGMNLIWK